MTVKMPVKIQLTEEHKAQLTTYKDRWIANALSTKKMDEEEKEICTKAVKELYTVSNVKPPEFVFFVKSPIALRFAGGLVAAYLTQNPTASEEDLQKIIDEVHYNLENPTTIDTSKWYIVNNTFIRALDTKLGLNGTGIDKIKACESEAWQGGNEWSSWCSFNSFFKDVVKLDLDYTAYIPWETLCLHSGPRLVYERFCMISDRPQTLLVDNAYRPHCLTGPNCVWRDGTKLFQVNGVRVPAFVVLEPSKITPELIDAEKNIEVRRVMLKQFGEDKYLMCGKYEVLDVDVDQFGQQRRLLAKKNGEDEPILRVEVVNSSPELDLSYKKYYLPVHPELKPLIFVTNKDGSIDPQKSEEATERQEPQKLTCHNAVASTFGLTGEEYRPKIES